MLDLAAWTLREKLLSLHGNRADIILDDADSAAPQQIIQRIAELIDMRGGNRQWRLQPDNVAIIFGEGHQYIILRL